MKGVIIIVFLAIIALVLAGCEGNIAGEARKPPTDTTAKICTDSDGGIVPGVKGTTVYGRTTSVDTCLDSTYLSEFYCRTNSRIGKTTIACSEMAKEASIVGTNYICEDGACIPEPNDDWCIDSDGGNNIYLSGHVNGSLNGNFYWQGDWCVNSEILYEWYCVGNYAINYTATCPAGMECQNAQCINTSIPDSCTDTDGGINLTVLGTVSGYDNNDPYSFTDYCNSTQVVEYYCSGTGYGYNFMNCPSGQACQNGVCTSSGYADLATMDLKFEDYNGSDLGNNWTQGDTIYPKIVIKNLGTGPQALVNIRYQMLLNQGPGLVGNCDTTGKVLEVNEIFKCQSLGGFTASVDLTMVTGTIDSTHILAESNENNNVRVESVYVTSNQPTDYCIDSDGGTNRYEFGWVNWSLNGNLDYRSDFCWNSDTLLEWYCQGTAALNVTMNCGSERECLNGQCVMKPYTCEETDGGWDYTVWGLNGGYYNGVHYSVSDFCYTNTTLLEYACVGDYLQNATVSCVMNGTSVCAGGRCV